MVNNFYLHSLFLIMINKHLHIKVDNKYTILISTYPFVGNKINK